MTDSNFEELKQMILDVKAEVNAGFIEIDNRLTGIEDNFSVLTKIVHKLNNNKQEK